MLQNRYMALESDVLLSYVACILLALESEHFTCVMML